MTNPDDLFQPAEGADPDLAPDDSPEAGASPGMATVTDDEFFAALEALGPLIDVDGQQVDAREGVLDLREPRAPGSATGPFAPGGPVTAAATGVAPVDVLRGAGGAPVLRGVAHSASVDFMRRVVVRMRAAGLVVIEHEGWETRGRPGTYAPRVVFEHHDASSVASGRFGALGIIANGRPGISGPLSQWQVTRGDGAWVLVAAGRANHAGLGGAYAGLPQDSANAYAMGAEVANDGISEPYSPQLHRSLDIGFACILAEMARDAASLIGHKEWARDGRKSDPRHSMAWRRGQVAAVLGGAVPPPAGPPVAPPPPPAPHAPHGPGLAVDGKMGPATVRAMQQRIGVGADGVMGPNTRRALQRHLHVTADGAIGPVTVRALQARVGVRQDGAWGPVTTKALQTALNHGRF